MMSACERSSRCPKRPALTLTCPVSAVHAQLWPGLQAPRGPVQERRERRHSAGIQVSETQSAHLEGALQP